MIEPTDTAPATDADARAELRSRMAAGILAAIAAIFCLTFWSQAADGNLVVFDSLEYVRSAETAPATSVLPHHPLFHILVLAVLQVARAVGCEHPGALAVRVVSGAGAAWLMWLIVRMAGAWRVTAGVLCALLLATTRVFAAEGAAGENLLPACAAALWLMNYAAQARPRLVTFGVGLFVTLLLRQDNILLLPAFVVLLARAWAWRPLIWTIAATGVATLAAYVLIWTLVDTQFTFGKWLTWYSNDLELLHHFTIPRLLEYVAAFANAVFGWQWSYTPSGADRALAGTWVVFVAVTAWIGRSRGADRRFVVAWIAALVPRIAFYTAFEPYNIEWHVLTIVAFSAMAARAARADSASPPRTAARVGPALLLIPIGAALFLTWPTLVRLRETRAVTTLDAALKDAGPGTTIMIGDWTCLAACRLRGLSFLTAESADPLKQAAEFSARAATMTTPLMLIVDRRVGDGSPFAVNGGALLVAPQLDEFHASPGGIRTFSVDGRACALIANSPPGRAPESRR